MVSALRGAGGEVRQRGELGTEETCKLGAKE